MRKFRNRDNGSAAVTGVILLIVLVLFIVAAAHMGITFREIERDFETFFTGSP